MKTTTIQLSDEDARAFINFQKHYTMINLMDSLGVFNITNGSVEIHFDTIGQIAKVDIHTHYHRPKTKEGI